MKKQILNTYVWGQVRLAQLKDRAVDRLKDRSGATIMEYVMLVAGAVLVGALVIKGFWGEYKDNGTGIGGILYKMVNSLEGQFGNRTN